MFPGEQETETSGAESTGVGCRGPGPASRLLHFLDNLGEVPSPARLNVLICEMEMIIITSASQGLGDQKRMLLKCWHMVSTPCVLS